jgi:hypothetical protein
MTPYSDEEILEAYELVRGAFERVLGASRGTFEEFNSEPEGVAIVCELIRAARVRPTCDECGHELGGEG